MENDVSSFLHLHGVWQNHKNQFSQTLQHKLNGAANPYKLALVFIKLCPDLYKYKSSGMAANILVQLQSFLDLQDEGAYRDCLTNVIQKDAFDVAVNQKNTGVMRLLVKAYQLKDISEQALPKLKAMMAKKQFKDVCTLATLLNLQEHFSTQELIIPLFCTDQLCLANEFLDSSPTHQREIVMFIDRIIGKDPDTLSLLKNYSIKDMGKFKSPKILGSSAAKLIKRYELDTSLCPNLYKKRALGGLRYMFYKYYIEKGLTASTFHSLVDDALMESPDLKLHLMDLFCEYCDPLSAAPYVTKFQFSSEEIPEVIKEAIANGQPSNSVDLSLSTADEECWDQEVVENFSLTISLEHVLMVDTVEAFEHCMKRLWESPVVGLDCEWKPTFGISLAEQVALMQLATLTHVYLIDIITLQPLLEDRHWTQLGHLFTDENIIKLGYGIKGDFKVLVRLHSELKQALTSPKNVIDFDQIKAGLLEASPDLFPFVDSSYKGLSDFVYRCFGKPLNKQEQFSNWTNRPLSESQKLYAAVDARCLVDIYNHIHTSAQELHIDNWRHIKAISPQKKVRHRKPNKEESAAIQVDRSPRMGPLTTKEISIVCDSMLEGLAKKLRLCGIDTVAIEGGQSSDDCIDFYEKEKRVVLSKGGAFTRLSKFVPSDFIYHVQSEGARTQLAEVMDTFKIELSSEDVFARCTKCNAGSYLVVPPSIITKMRKNSNLSENVSDEWFICDGGKVNLCSGLTDCGVKVRVEKLIDAVILKTKEIFICTGCGRCYWEGSHQLRAYQEIVSKYLRPEDRDPQTSSSSDSERVCSDRLTDNYTSIENQNTNDDGHLPISSIIPDSKGANSYIEDKVNNLSISATNCKGVDEI